MLLGEGLMSHKGVRVSGNQLEVIISQGMDPLFVRIKFKLSLLEWKNKKKEENNDTDSYVDSFEDDDKVSEKEVSHNNLSHSKSKNSKRGSNAKIQSIKGK